MPAIPNPSKQHDVVVVGGGVLGIFAALEIARAGRHVTLLEGSPNLGGLGRGLEIGGFDIDIGVRMQPNTDPEVTQRFLAAVGDSRGHRYSVL